MFRTLLECFGPFQDASAYFVVLFRGDKYQRCADYAWRDQEGFAGGTCTCISHTYACFRRPFPVSCRAIRRALSLSSQVGIQNYSAAISCSFPPRQKRSDYSKLFVVLVVIGSVCTIIITSGFIYICWKRRLPATKTTVRYTPVAHCV